MKITSKIAALLLAALLVFTFTACNNDTAANPENGTEGDIQAPATDETPDAPLADIMATLYYGLEELPFCDSIALDADNFTTHAFADYVEGAEAYMSQAMMNAVAHSVVLVRLPEGSDVDAFVAEVTEKVNPRKWVCTEAEKVHILNKGRLVLIDMSFEATADAIAENFKSFDGTIKLPEVDAPAEDEFTVTSASDLRDIMGYIYSGSDIYGDMEIDITADNFADFFFTEFAEGCEGYASYISDETAPVHSIALVRIPEGADAEAFKAVINENAEVKGEKFNVLSKGNVVLVVMASEANCDAISANFENIAE